MAGQDLTGRVTTERPYTWTQGSGVWATTSPRKHRVVAIDYGEIEQPPDADARAEQPLFDLSERDRRVLFLRFFEDWTQKEIGEEIATRADFEGPLDVVPVSDPNIFSEAQRFAQVQAVEQRAQAMPQLYNLRKVEERILETLKIPNAKELLAPAMEPKEQNAVSENVAASLGRAVLAFPEQDHIAHLKTHLAYLTNPAFGMNPLIAPAYIPVMLNHIKEHIALWYASAVFDLSNDATGGDIGEDLKEMKDSPEDRKALDRLLAEASMLALESGQQVFQSMPPVIQQAQQIMQQLTPPMPMDPSQAALQQAQLNAQVQQQRAQAPQQDIDRRYQPPRAVFQPACRVMNRRRHERPPGCQGVEQDGEGVRFDPDIEIGDRRRAGDPPAQRGNHRRQRTVCLVGRCADARQEGNAHRHRRQGR